ncbi:hypothetical protein ACEUZ9_000085 [Paracoccus litorisediminis]|uniref:hypothetical protein n=1 Tax=Paracoccus litorisediminis TaxID=2006130 RepID=UPI003733670C
MIYVASITAGIVAQVTVEPDDYQPASDHVVIGPNNIVGVGWTWNGSAFAPPSPAPDEHPE